MSLSKEQILAADDSKKELVQVPEWGGEVWVKCMSGSDRDTWEFSIFAERQKAEKEGRSFSIPNFRARLVAATLCNEKGERLFSNEEIVVLGNKSSAALESVFLAARRINKLRDEDVESLVKN